FDAMLEKAMRLCGAVHGTLTEYDGEYFRCVASYNLPEALFQILNPPRRAVPNSPQQRLLDGERIVHIADVTAMPISPENEVARAAAEIKFQRTLLFVPLRRDDTLLGYITATRGEVRLFSDKQIALLENFAAQAVIAMENARLLTETREALGQQTATPEALQGINSWPGELPPVFGGILEEAMELCGAAFGMFWIYEGSRFQVPALRGVPPAFAEFVRKPLGPFHRGTGLGRMLHGEDLAIHRDMGAEEAYRAGDPLRRAIVDLGGARSA